jgi:hypothetical protein
MKYIKEFESYEDLPKVGDYVVLDVDKFSYFNVDFIDFIRENVAIINNNSDSLYNGKKVYSIKFDIKNSFLNINDDDEITGLQLDDFIFWSSNKLEAEIYLNSMKYNL